MDKILIVISVILFGIFFVMALSHGVKLSETNECLKWQEESSIYPDYYFTKWQIEQCENYNINLK